MPGHVDTTIQRQSPAIPLTKVLITAICTAVAMGVAIYASIAGDLQMVSLIAACAAFLGLLLIVMQIAIRRRESSRRDPAVRSPKKLFGKRPPEAAPPPPSGPRYFGPSSQPNPEPGGQHGQAPPPGSPGQPSREQRSDAQIPSMPPAWAAGADPSRAGSAGPAADESPTQLTTAGAIGLIDPGTVATVPLPRAIPARSEIHQSLPEGPPVFDDGSTAGRAPWHLPKGFAPAGLTADGLRLGDIEARAASVVGPSHRCQEPATARQDAYLLRRSDDGNHLIVAVADGVGQSSHSDLGARVAVSAAARGVAEVLDRCGDPNQIDARQLFTAVAGEMIGTAQQQAFLPDEVYSILVVVVIPVFPGPGGNRQLWTAQIGDVSVWMLQSGVLQQLTGPQKKGMDKNTLKYVLPVDPDGVRQTSVELHPGDTIAVMTDGLSDSLTNIPAVDAFFSRRWAAGPPHPAAFLQDMCFDAPGQSDDRTAVVAWINATDQPRGRST